MFALILISLGCIFALGIWIMTPTIIPKLLKPIFDKLKRPKSIKKPSIIAITEEDKIKWQKLVQKCGEDSMIDDETLPPLFDNTDPIMEFDFNLDLKK